MLVGEMLLQRSKTLGNSPPTYQTPDVRRIHTSNKHQEILTTAKRSSCPDIQVPPSLTTPEQMHSNPPTCVEGQCISYELAQDEEALLS